MSTSGNIPNTPLVGANGRLAPEWFAFFLAILQRTGGTGSPTDITSLQKEVVAQAAEIADLFSMEGSIAAASMVGALVLRIASLEQLSIAGVAVPPRAPNTEIALAPVLHPQPAAVDQPVQVPTRPAPDSGLPVHVPTPSFSGATTATAPAAGSGGALPATPAGYATVFIGGVPRKIAFY